MKNIKNGLLVTVEGIDGSGKSSLIKGLTDHFNNDYSVVTTKEPGGSLFGPTVRSLLLNQTTPLNPKAEFLLFAADRAQHFAEKIIPALAQGKLIFSDRMADSSLIYQGYGKGLSLERINSVNAWAMNNKQPDIVLYLRLSSDEAYKRIHSRNEPLTSFEKEAVFMEKLTDGFDTLVAPRKEVVTIDAQASQKEVLIQAIEAISLVLKERNAH